MKRPASPNMSNGPVMLHHDHVTNGHDGAVSMDASSPPLAEPDKVAILDCGAQYGKVIDRRVREMSVESEILPLNTSAETLLKHKYKALIISGGPSSVYASNAPDYDAQIFRCGLPVLGICYGFQLICKEFGGDVKQESTREDGQCEVSVENSCAIFTALNDQETVLLTHGDSVISPPAGFEVIAKSGNLVAGIANESKKIYGLQFHPEVDLTDKGKLIIENFLFSVARLQPTYTMQRRETACLQEIISRVPQDQKVLIFVSGGVDSTVCAALLHKALKQEQLLAVHIDNGFMRKNESKQVYEALTNIGINPIVYHGKYLFRSASPRQSHPYEEESQPLYRTVDPEIKRKIIGDTFMKVMDEIHEEQELDPENVLLCQGTLRPDLIESASALASKHADAIKTHHNDTPMVRELRERGRVIEPLKDFHKDEVRCLGKELGLPDSIVQRHPFPGPGLAIRILCCLEPFMGRDFRDTELMLNAIARYGAPIEPDQMEKHERQCVKIRACFSDSELRKLTELCCETDKYSCTLLPVKTVGVQGDCRSYSYVAALSTDVRPIPWVQLRFLAKIIPKILHNINRVVYVFGPRLLHPVRDVTPTLLTDSSVNQIREADLFATKVLNQSAFARKISQMPVVLVPVHFERALDSGVPSCKRSVCLRPFVTNDFMTGNPAIPTQDIDPAVVLSMCESIVSNVPLVSRVMYDLTSKPPGTTEWE